MKSQIKVMRTVHISVELDDQLRIMAYSRSIPQHKFMEQCLVLGMQIDAARKVKKPARRRAA